MGQEFTQEAKKLSAACCSDRGDEMEITNSNIQPAAVNRARSPLRIHQQQSSVLVRNVHTGSHEDLRWAFDREQSNRGNQNSDNVDSAFIDSVLSKEFFSKYAEEDEETLRN